MMTAIQMRERADYYVRRARDEGMTSIARHSSISQSTLTRLRLILKIGKEG